MQACHIGVVRLYVVRYSKIQNGDYKIRLKNSVWIHIYVNNIAKWPVLAPAGCGLTSETAIRQS